LAQTRILKTGSQVWKFELRWRYESFNEKLTYGFRMAKGVKGFPNDFMGMLVKVFS
jgi:hypothetical protein